MIIKIDHINLSVANMDESIDWYKKIFGFELVESGVKEDGQRWAIVAYNDFMICMGEYGKREYAYKHQVMHQINHFGIRISDRKKWEQIIRTHKLKLNYGGVSHYPSSVSWYVEDPSGHDIEVSYAPTGRLRFPTGN